MTDATYIKINGVKYTIGDYVKYGLNLNTPDEIIFTEGYVTFGEFSAEIYTCYGFYVADKNGNQVSEAGLDDQYIIINH